MKRKNSRSQNSPTKRDTAKRNRKFSHSYSLPAEQGVNTPRNQTIGNILQAQNGRNRNRDLDLDLDMENNFNSEEGISNMLLNFDAENNEFDSYGRQDQHQVDLDKRINISDSYVGEKDTYTPLYERGHGGFGSVWEAMNSKDEKVAVKIFHPNAIDYSIEKEFGLLLKGTGNCYPFVVCILDYGHDLTNPFIVYELMDGDLLNYVFHSWDEILQCMEETCKGLRWLNEKFIAHGDVKPANILYKMNSYGRTVFKIGDLGGACAEIGVLEDKMIDSQCFNKGTFLYMAPEIISHRFERNTYLGVQRSDVFSLGITFYYIITKFLYGADKGTLPYDNVGGIPYRELIEMHLINKTPIPPLLQDEIHILRLGNSIEEKLIESIVNGMLQVEPTKRITLTSAINKIETFNRQFA